MTGTRDSEGKGRVLRWQGELTPALHSQPAVCTHGFVTISSTKSKPQVSASTASKESVASVCQLCSRSPAQLLADTFCVPGRGLFQTSSSKMGVV